MDKIAITGANGYLGHFVSTHFESMGQQVVKINRNNAPDSVSRNFYEVEQIDCSSIKSLILAGFPPSSITSSNYAEIIRNSICSALNLGLHLSGFGLERIVIIGSYWQEPTGQAYYPFNYYATCKQLLEITMSALVLNGVDVRVLHLGDVYGPNDTRQKLIPELIRAHRENKKPLLRSPESKMSPIWVYDVVDAIQALLQIERSPTIEYRVYSGLGEATYSVAEVAKLIEETFGNFHRGIAIAENYEKKGVTLIPQSRYPRPFNWKPTVSLEQGLTFLKTYES